LYSKEFYGWDDIIPYDRQDPNEGKMRVLIENVKSMQINHYAFIGTEDEAFYLQKEELDNKANNTKLKIFYIRGDHFSSLQPAMEKFIDIINNKEK
jgi:surfactin synthase thioesterase subunit